MNLKYYLKQVELKTGIVSVIDSYEDYGDAVEDMAILSNNDGNYGYYISAYC